MSSDGRLFGELNAMEWCDAADLFSTLCILLSAALVKSLPRIHPKLQRPIILRTREGR